MKKLILFFFVSAVCLAETDAQEVKTAAKLKNPIVREFIEDLTFYHSFDTVKADLAFGKPDPESSSAILNAGPFGSCMTEGNMTFSGPGNVDLSTSGSVVIWMAYKNFPTEKPKNGKSPSWWAFTSNKGKYTVLAGLPGQFNWPGGVPVAFVTAPKMKQVEVYLWGRNTKWKNGEWHMLALVWTPTSMGYSVDGCGLESSPLPEALSGDQKSFSIGGTTADKGFAFSCDELMIFSKSLSNAEIQKIYNTMKPK